MTQARRKVLSLRASYLVLPSSFVLRISRGGLFQSFPLLIQLFHLDQACVGERSILGRELLFDVAKPPLKFGVAAAQGLFRIDLPAARDIGDDEQQVAEFVFDANTADGVIDWNVGDGLGRDVGGNLGN